MAARFARHLGNRILPVAQLVAQPRIGLRFLDGGKILPLDILDERNGEGIAVIELAHDRGNLMQPGALRCPPAAFARHQLPAMTVGRGADENRLDQAARGNRVGKLGQCIFIEMAAWLFRVRMHLGDGQHGKAVTGRRSGRAVNRRIDLDIAEQRGKTAPQPARPLGARCGSCGIGPVVAHLRQPS